MAWLGHGWDGISGTFLPHQSQECLWCDTRPVWGHSLEGDLPQVTRPQRAQSSTSGTGEVQRAQAEIRGFRQYFTAGLGAFPNRQTMNSRDTVLFHRARSKRSGLCHCVPLGHPQLIPPHLLHPKALRTDDPFASSRSTSPLPLLAFSALPSPCECKTHGGTGGRMAPEWWE